MDYSVKTSHPHFFNQLFAETEPAAIGGELLTAVANTSMYTYEVAPVFAVMEDLVLARMRASLGWTQGDGIFCPGGSISNMYGVNLARHHFCPEIKTKGNAAAGQLVGFYSAQAHYSIRKGFSFLGLGSENLIVVPCDEHGRMVVDELDKAIAKAKEEGKKPFYINTTAATTVLGAYDDYEAIADVAEKHGCWMHIDGAWGASVILSNTHKTLMKGCERANSVSWNPHKMMGIPLQCSAFLVQTPDVLMQAHCANAAYLFQKDKLNAHLDTGDKAVQCGRKVDVLKLWMAWKFLGDTGFEARIDHAFNTAAALRANILARPASFRLVASPESVCTNVCFWFLPPSVRGEGAPAEGSDEWRKKVHAAPVVVKQKAQEQGAFMVGFQSIVLANDPSPPNFFRMISIGPNVHPEDMIWLLDQIETLGADC
eukprot:TRINITY_DN22195_c0_g1_i1.p1 TRINITY_DN22195_c0_g1~~TRINITY_DN22195_c0_g1_i1.p1  ORF type:complete len:427 (+),score=143.68 TRINITY_DN22195_c0_g1_i1:300-1580(+)